MKPDVLLLSAGFGSRLRPLTDTCPKPLIPVAGKPLLVWNLELLARSGFSRVFINLHYLGEMIREFVGDGSTWGLHVEYSDEPLLLDTGGAIKAIESRLQSDLLLTLNSDILVDAAFPFEDLLHFHTNHPRHPEATLVLRTDADADRFGSFESAADNTIVRMLDARHPAGSPAVHSGLMYTGIQVMGRALIAQMPEAGTVFSLTRDTFRTAIHSGAILGAYRYSGYWSDVGTPDRLEAASIYMNSRR